MFVANKGPINCILVYALAYTIRNMRECDDDMPVQEGQLGNPSSALVSIISWTANWKSWS